MPNQHKNPQLGFRPEAELSAWVRDEADRRNVDYSVILIEAVTEYRKRAEYARTVEARTANREIAASLNATETTQTGEQA